MTGMQLYVKFVFTLSIGLVGLGMVLTVLLETVLREWDAPREILRWWRHLTHGRAHASSIRAEDILLELEHAQKEHRYERRLPAGSIDQRREEMRAIREAEERLAAPSAV
ncbi:MAG: hypothetical protein A2506_03380 [Elusimicrobia bacterium RIFOXYD12_FULL_66_9]|nr:MAG: hypothetical protein A2506_03380 [Elusimicrobia bacterium RIFOXYD12_FULL_66_9]